MIEIRNATHKDLIEFYGKDIPVTVRAIVALRDGVIECVAGVVLNTDIAFSDMKTTAGKMDIFKTALKMIKWMRKYHPVVTLTGNDRKSEKFLKKLGFEFLNEKDGVYLYKL